MNGKLLFVLIISFSLAACSSIQKAEYRLAPEVPRDASTPPLSFSGLKIRLPKGSDVGHISHTDLGCLYSLPVGPDVVRGQLNKEELRDGFENALEPLGYDVISSVTSFFFEEEMEAELMRTEYKVGAKMVALQLDACAQDADLGLFGFTREGVKGELLATYEWSVFDNIQKKTVYKTQTKGYAKRRTVNREGMALLIYESFEMAAHNLGADPAFHDLMVSGYEPDKSLWDRGEERALQRTRIFDAQESVSLQKKPLSQRPLLKHMEQSRKAAVLVQAGRGHGSGFFITNEGHILTNAHVVGNAGRVRIVTSGKQEKLAAEVLRVNKTRDVALLKLEQRPDFEVMTLPARTHWPDVGEDVFLIGAPMSTKLQDTVTKGIISAHRPKFPIFGTKVDLLQADVAVQGGNSGGPLVDQYGNIVGITVAGVGLNNEALNYFIPIKSALKTLKIEY